MKYNRFPKRDAIKNYFPLPNELFILGLNAGEISVYSYLLYLENRKTFQCWPSYKTIGKAVGMTLGEWLDRWLAEYKEDTVRPGTIRSYRTVIEQYIKPQLGDKQISLITPQDIQRMYRRLKKEGRVNEHPEKGTQLADNTVRGIHCVLHLAMGCSLLALYQNAGVGLILQNVDNGCR